MLIRKLLKHWHHSSISQLCIYGDGPELVLGTRRKWPRPRRDVDRLRLETETTTLLSCDCYCVVVTHETFVNSLRSVVLLHNTQYLPVQLAVEPATF